MTRTARFDIYGRLQILVEQSEKGYQLYVLGAEGKKRPFHDFEIPEKLPFDGLDSYLDDMFHELAMPGKKIKKI